MDVIVEIWPLMSATCWRSSDLSSGSDSTRSASYSVSSRGTEFAKKTSSSVVWAFGILVIAAMLRWLSSICWLSSATRSSRTSTESANVV